MKPLKRFLCSVAAVSSLASGASASSSSGASPGGARIPGDQRAGKEQLVAKGREITRDGASSTNYEGLTGGKVSAAEVESQGSTRAQIDRNILQARASQRLLGLKKKARDRRNGDSSNTSEIAVNSNGEMVQGSGGKRALAGQITEM